MGFRTAVLPDVDLETFGVRPFFERMRVLQQHWVDHGFGSPWVTHLKYGIKLVAYVVVGVLFASRTSGLGPLSHIATWWTQPIFYQKLLIWTQLYEILNFGASCGPLAFRFKPTWVGGPFYWLRPGTIRLPPWPGKNPLAGGSRRGVADVALYSGVLLADLWLLLSDGRYNHVAGGSLLVLDNRGVIVLVVLLAVAGLRDRLLFLAARGEIYWVAAIFFTIFPYVDLIISLKLLMVVVWWGAATSKLGRHFPFVVQAMTSNAPILNIKWLRRKLYRKPPEDLLPSPWAAVLGHTGTVIEYAVPAVLLFSTNHAVTAIAAAVIGIFHIFIVLNFPLAVPLEWNVFFVFSAVWLFVMHPADSFGVWSASPSWLPLVVFAALAFFPVLGNLRPDLVSFLPSARYYAGNWATGLWAFKKPDADQLSGEDRIDRNVIKSAKFQVTQLAEMYGRPVAELFMQKAVAWRLMNAHGRALTSILLPHLTAPEDYDIREGEFVLSSVVGWQFGDGHLQNEFFIQAIQDRCVFQPGELVVVLMESQPLHRPRQHYRVIDAALGEIERGFVTLPDMLSAQPWLPDGPVPVHIASQVRRPTSGSDAATAG